MVVIILWGQEDDTPMLDNTLMPIFVAGRAYCRVLHCCVFCVTATILAIILIRNSVDIIRHCGA